MWSLVALHSPLRSLQSASKGFKASLAPEVDARGWFHAPTQLRPPDLSQNSARLTIARHHLGRHAENEPTNLALLEHLISTLRERKVEVVLVTLPVWKTYAEEMRADEWARTQATFEQLAKKHGARYLSFLREPRLEAADFLDTDHLNAQGAVRFTRMLNEAL
jgi:hypothetical protein